MGKYLFFLLFGVLAISAGFPDSVENGTETNLNLFAVSDSAKTCLECHQSVIEFEEVHAPVRKKCESCHLSNGEEHPLDNVKGFELRDSVPQLCYTCHDPLNESEHIHDPVAKGKCFTCHAPHGSPNLYILKDAPSKLCLECHELDTENAKMMHQPVTDGDCVSCHNPHQSDTKNLLEYPIPLLCKRCHKDIKKELKKETLHAPFKKKCLNCHNAHSSKEDHLSDKKVPDLCYTCHDPLNESEHVHDPVEKGKCFTCHFPHSSDNLYLLKADPPGNLCIKCHEQDTENAKMIHQPVADGDCVSCHNPHQSDTKNLLEYPIPLLCKRCHKDIKKELKKETLHAPFKKKCLKCHNAHSSKEDHLSDKKVPDLCYTCHDPLNEMENVHDPVAKGKCFTCHAPHSSDNLYLLNANPTGNLCVECHELDTENDKMIHQPVFDGDCAGCHNPHQSDTEKLLQYPIPLLCKRCHKDIKKALKLENMHAPFKKECSECHQPHSSKEDHLIDLKSKDLCLSCHDELKNKIGNAPLVHQALNEERNCQNCHSPHASTEKKILLSREKELCLSCHNKSKLSDNKKILNIKQLLEKNEFVHGAIEEKGCSSCHDPHSSDRPQLLLDSFPENRYITVEPGSFALCFKCHEREMIEVAVTTTATNFRNGDQNLHYFHVNGKKGRNCKLCHDVHAAKNEFLIAEKVKFGSWEMPIKFTKMENGGSCATGCHSEKKYERQPVLKIEKK